MCFSGPVYLKERIFIRLFYRYATSINYVEQNLMPGTRFFAYILRQWWLIITILHFNFLENNTYTQY